MVNRSLNSVVVLVRLAVNVQSDAAVVVVIPINYQTPPFRRRCRRCRRTSSS